MSAEIGRLIASCFALAAFAIAVLAGLMGGNEAAQILLRAVGATAICYVLGMIVGMICDSVIHAHVSAKSADAPSRVSTELQSEPAGASVEAGEGTSSIDREAVRTRAAA